MYVYLQQMYRDNRYNLYASYNRNSSEHIQKQYHNTLIMDTLNNKTCSFKYILITVTIIQPLTRTDSSSVVCACTLYMFLHRSQVHVDVHVHVACQCEAEGWTVYQVHVVYAITRCISKRSINHIQRGENTQEYTMSGPWNSLLHSLIVITPVPFINSHTHAIHSLSLP